MEANVGAPRKLNILVSHNKAQKLSTHCKLLVVFTDLNEVVIVLGNGKPAFACGLS